MAGYAERRGFKSYVVDDDDDHDERIDFNVVFSPEAPITIKIKIKTYKIKVKSYKRRLSQLR